MKYKDDKLNEELMELESLAFELSFFNALAVILLVLAVALVIAFIISNPLTLPHFAVLGFIFGINLFLAGSGAHWAYTFEIKDEIKKQRDLIQYRVKQTASSENLRREENNTSNSTRNREKMDTGLNDKIDAVKAEEITPGNTGTGLPHATVVSPLVAEAVEEPQHATVVSDEFDNSGLPTAIPLAEEELAPRNREGG